MIISETDLILNPDGSIYHLCLHPENIADIILTVGDPDRVPMISKYFDSLEFSQQKREFVTHTGRIGKQRISVISSGIGTDNVEILMNELDSLVNIDLASRTEKNTHKSLKIIRLGTSGSLQVDIPVDSFLLSEQAIGLDNLAFFYDIDTHKNSPSFCKSLQKHLNFHSPLYAIAADSVLLDSFTETTFFKKGITITCPGFYAPQGRNLRYSSKQFNWLSKLQQFNAEGKRLSNLEMETFAYYMFGQVLGHHTLSLNAILANRITHEFSRNPEKQIEQLILKALSIICP